MIAATPAERRGIARDEVRLLVTDRAAGAHKHARFYELPAFLRRGDVLVVNDSRTLPAALIAQRENGERIPLHVATMLDRRLWTAEPRGTVHAGEELRLPAGARAVPIAPVDRERPRLWYTQFHLPAEMQAYLSAYGEPIRYAYTNERYPLSYYQTIFAEEPGSAEMPSAARPFTPRVLDAVREAGAEIVSVTLHCGVASFEAPELPGTERFAVSPGAAAAVNRARREGRRIIAVGSTPLRALESASQHGVVVAASGWTDLVMDERRPPRVADALLTGFHDRAATHHWILRAFLSAQLLGEAYAQAETHGYNQHEFGDVHLIL